MPPNHPSYSFPQSCGNASLAQLVKESPRVKDVGAGNLPDLVLTNCKVAVNQLTLQSPIGKSDQATTIHSITRLKVEHEKQPSCYVYNKGDYKMIKTLLQVN